MKHNLKKPINIFLGLVGMALLFMGYIFTFGSLGLMEINPKYGVKPGDIYKGFEYSLLFVLLPSLLIRGTLGKYVKSLNFSGRFITGLVILAILAGTTAELGTTYNFAVYSQEHITNTYKQIDIVYDKKFELTSGIKNVLEEYMKYENTTFDNIAKARSNYFGNENLNDKVSAANVLDRELNLILVNIESYPELKANEQANEYIKTLVNLENELAVKKVQYNEQVKNYNTQYKEFPNVLIMRLFGFEEMSYFETSLE